MYFVYCYFVELYRPFPSMQLLTAWHPCYVYLVGGLTKTVSQASPHYAILCCSIKCFYNLHYQGYQEPPVQHSLVGYQYCD